MTLILRPYQAEAVAAVRAGWKAGGRCRRCREER